jgi:hypothetical protein
MPSDPEVFEVGMTVVLATRLTHHSGGIRAGEAPVGCLCHSSLSGQTAVT